MVCVILIEKYWDPQGAAKFMHCSETLLVCSMAGVLIVGLQAHKWTQEILKWAWSFHYKKIKK